MATYRAEWTARVKGRLNAADGFPGIVEDELAAGGACANWNMKANPQGTAERFLEAAISIAIGEWQHPYRQLFLGWANESAEKALNDPRFSIESSDSRKGWKIKGVYPGNHGATLAAAALARAMSDDAVPDGDMLVQAAHEILQTALESKGPDWDDHIEQGRYVRAIQLLLIAGETAEARALFKTRRGLKRVQLLYRWLEGVVEGIPDAAPSHAATEVQSAHFSERFDLIRDPSYAPAPLTDNMGGHIGQNLMLLRLELALIKYRFVLGQPYAGQWRDIVGLIAE